jgi:hypothetical protein
MKSPCHGGSVPRDVSAGIGLDDVWVLGLRAAVVVVLVVVVVVGMRAIDHRDHGESDETRRALGRLRTPDDPTDPRHRGRQIGDGSFDRVGRLAEDEPTLDDG